MPLRSQYQYDQLLKQHGLRKTAFRKEVLSIFLQHEGKAIANTIIEEALVNYDRITLYRTLKSFEEKGLVHIAVDGSDQTKYALCGRDCDEDQHTDTHAHFNCSTCGSTTCLDDLSKRLNELVPHGYKVREFQIAFNGVCKQCA